jgi:ketosteroid isomerase-like protein
MRNAWREWLTPWKSYRLDAERIIDAGEDVVVFARVEAQTERDGVAVQHSPAAIWKFRQGKIVAIHFYLDRAEALEAAGVSTEEMAAKSE